MVSGRKGSWRFVALACVGVLLIAEGIVRSAPKTVDSSGPNGAQTLLQGHPSRIWSLIPGTNNNGLSTATINALGLRGPEPVTPRPADTQRILVLGDSAFFGHSVADQETLPYFLEAQLRDAGMKVEVINAGIPGYSILQGRELLNELAWDLEPTLLLLGFLWSDNNFETKSDREMLDARKAARFNPLTHSALFLWVVEKLTHSLRPEGQTIDWTTTTDSKPTAENQVRRVSLGDYAEALTDLLLEAKKRNAGAMMLAPTNLGQVSGETPRRHSSWMPYYDAQSDVAEAHGIPVFDILPALQAANLPLNALFVDKMHPTGQANALIAEALVDTLTSAGWPNEALQARSNPNFDPRLREDPHASGWSTPPPPEVRQPSPLDGLKGAGPGSN